MSFVARLLRQHPKAFCLERVRGLPDDLLVRQVQSSAYTTVGCYRVISHVKAMF